MKMECPACGGILIPLTVSDVTVDVCQGGCGGIWFDQFELKKLDEPHEEAGVALLEIERKPGFTVDQTKRIRCTKCPDSVMMRNFFSAKRRVEVDECPTCGSFWLDVGELAQIRSLFRTEQERKIAAAAYFREVLGDKIATKRAENAEQLARARRIANIFKFICPSYYIPGKQDGGAF
jgi:Zn-finger nucleic acid-binding protein